MATFGGVLSKNRRETQPESRLGRLAKLSVFALLGADIVPFAYRSAKKNGLPVTGPRVGVFGMALAVVVGDVVAAPSSVLVSGS